MKAHILEKLNDLKIKSGKSLEAVHEKYGYATSTVHRWLKGESDPTLEQLTNMVEFFGGNMHDLFAEVGKQELTVTQTIGYQGANAMVEHYEQRLLAKDEKYQLLKDHHEQRVEEINENHGRSVKYLKDEIERLRGELDTANKAAMELAKAVSDSLGKKHIVFWVMAGIIGLLCVCLIFAILSDSPF